MAKTKIAFFCQSCGTQYAKWQGQCTACKAWNTIVEEIVIKDEKVAWKQSSDVASRAVRPLRVSDIDSTHEIRLNSKNQEFNRVLGGGIVPGSVTLLGGEPGIGKSTLLLQIALFLPYQNPLCIWRGKSKANQNAVPTHSSH